MKKIMMLAVWGSFALVAGPLGAETAEVDPLARNLIFVEGESDLTVPVDGFSLTLDFDIEKASFEDANQQADEIIQAIRKHVDTLGLKNVEIIKGWDVVRQYKVSFGAKGRKVSNRLLVRVADFPEGQLHTIMAKLIDRSIAVDDRIALVDVNVFLSETLENQKKEEALTHALEKLQSNAQKAAQAVGRTLSAPKRIFITSDAESAERELAQAMPYGSGVMLESSQSFARKSMISVQKSFKVEAQIVEQIKMTAKVTGIYQLD